MATRSVRVFITDARLSYPALDEPKETMAGNGDLKYQATFLIAPDNPCVAKIKDAIKQIAIAEYGDKAKAVVTNREKIPLKKGDDKENIPDGYAGMLYISAKSKNRPELRDANPKIRIIEKEEIREKFTAGYRVNAYVDLYPYAVRNSGGAIIKSGIAAGLVSVQFKAYADAFSGRKPLTPFILDMGQGVSVTAIFYDYYIRSKHISFANERQREITQRVLELKDGENPSSDLYSEALKILEEHFSEIWRCSAGPVIIFMPCRGEQAHFCRFASLARSLSRRYRYNTDINAVQYIGIRQSKHLSHNRDAIESSSNIVVSPRVIGKEVVIIDDVITTGNSLREFAAELHGYGVKVRAAVFLAHTARLPSDGEIHQHIKNMD